MQLKKLNVDLDEVVEAMEQGDEMGLGMSSYLDSQTGRIVAIGGDLSFDANDPPDEFPDDASDWEREAWEDARAVAGDTSGRFHEIPQRGARDAWQVMADFVAEVPDPRMRERLETAIAGKGAFGRFKDALHHDSEVRERWFVFEQAQKREWAEEWLEELGIESTWSPPVVKQKAGDWQPKVIGIHHVQITVPAGQEQAARDFYCKVMGLREIEKPKALKGRGGLWLEVGDLQVHVGAESGGDRSATKAHVAYQVTDLAKWRDRLEKAGARIMDSVPIPGFARFEFRDQFGNRVELIQPLQTESDKI
jgi:catechol 2,3-dioxygenase-like lactoylglutathione lyase family enzyme